MTRTPQTPRRGSPERVLILGAAGRDFHNFNVVFRADSRYQVVGFTAAQIPGIADRHYPAVLAGPRYPGGVPIYDEAELEQLIAQHGVSKVVFAYSDVSHEHVMHLASRASAAGADFLLLGSRRTMIEADVPVVAVCAVRTGCGKSQTSRMIADRARAAGLRLVVVRHPMPYGDLSRQVVQRFASYEDLDHHQCTLEEREEYEAHLEQGTVVYAGVDYEQVLAQAQREADILIWDGGNNDTPFIEPDLWLTVADPLRAGHEVAYHPGETNFRAADIILVGKTSVASAEQLATVERHAQLYNPGATLIRVDSSLELQPATSLAGQRVLVVEDGPTLTHGAMAYGAAYVAAQRLGAAAIVDPRTQAVGAVREAYARYPHLGSALPAVGYSAEEIEALRQTIENTDCDLVLYATPIDLGRLLKLKRPLVRVRYELLESADQELSRHIDAWLRSYSGSPSD